MKKIMTMFGVGALAVALSACGNGETGAPGEEGGESTFPDRQVRYIVPYGPGGLSDITARVIESSIRQNDLLSENFTVTNIDGASAGNGMNEVLRADPDGHTLLHHHTSFIAHKLSGVRDWGYEEFTPVAQLFEVPHVVFTHPDQYETMEEYLQDVEANPGQTTIGTSSPGGLTYLNMIAMLHQLEIQDDVTYVAHGGGGDLNTAILGGENNVGVGQLPQHIGYHNSGDLRILAVASDERLDSIPDVPTFAEVGLDMESYIVQTMGVWAPPETPENVVDDLYDLFESVVESDEFIQAGAEQGFTPLLGDGEVLRQQFEQDEVQLVEFLEETGLSME